MDRNYVDVVMSKMKEKKHYASCGCLVDEGITCSIKGRTREGQECTRYGTWCLECLLRYYMEDLIENKEINELLGLIIGDKQIFNLKRELHGIRTGLSLGQNIPEELTPTYDDEISEQTLKIARKLSKKGLDLKKKVLEELSDEISEKLKTPKALSLRDSFAVFLADFKAKLGM